MKALRLFCLLPLSILCLKMTAQVEDLTQDKSITWIAESYNDFFANARIAEELNEGRNKAKLIESYDFTEENAPENCGLQHAILKAAKEGKFSLYADGDCNKPISYDELCLKDTIVEENLISKKIEMRVVVHEPITAIHRLLFLRAHQIVYFDTQKVQFGLRTLAIAIMIRAFNKEDQPSGFRPYFWIKANDLLEKYNLSDDAITWMKTVELRNGVALASDNVKILKQINDSVPIAPLFQAVLTKPNIPFYRPDSLPLWVKYTFAETQKLFIRRDTACSGIDPDPNQTKLTIINSDIYPTDIVGLRLIQNWYWDDKKKRLEIYLVATAPLKNVNNEAGEFLFRQALFYRRTDD
jgi:Gliding motility associated protein GldN